MATASQINANRENAKASTGPQTPEGKAKSSRNNTKFGLFATNNCVQPEEQEDYENFSTALWTTLAPADPVEEVTAAEFVRNAWRLRRCAMAEETLGEIVARFQASQNKARGTDHPADPMIYPTYLPAQTAIDRARTSAQSGMRRAKADLDKMQAARKKAQTPAVLQVEPNIETVPAENPQVEPKSDRVAPEKQPQTVPAAAEFSAFTENQESPVVNTAPTESKRAA